MIDVNTLACLSNSCHLFHIYWMTSTLAWRRSLSQFTRHAAVKNNFTGKRIILPGAYFVASNNEQLEEASHLPSCKQNRDHLDRR